MPGTYLVDLYLTSSGLGYNDRNLDVVHEAIAFSMVPADVFDSGKLPPAVAGPIFWPGTFDLQLSPNRHPAPSGTG